MDWQGLLMPGAVIAAYAVWALIVFRSKHRGR
jgi:hypothetical protein